MDPDITRRVALCELLEMPDPPDIHRGHVVRLEGKPDRHELVPVLAAAFAREKVEKLPDLFESTVKEADAAIEQIKSKTMHAPQPGTPLGETGPQPPPSRKTDAGAFLTRRQRNE